MKNLLLSTLLVTGLAAILPGQTYTITTVAGSSATIVGDGGQSTTAPLGAPVHTVVDAAGNVYFTDANNGFGRIRKIDTTGVISTLSQAINDPRGLAIDAAGAFLYVADNGGHRIRKVDTVTGANTPVAGTGTSGFSGDGRLATLARIRNPRGVALDSAGNIFFTDTLNNRVRRVDVVSGIITTVAGRGPTNTTPAVITGVTTANQIVNGVSYPAGVSLALAASTNSAGDGGKAILANLAVPEGVAVDATGNIYIADTNYSRIRKVDKNGIITTVAGIGTTTIPGTNPGVIGDGVVGSQATFNAPKGLAIDKDGNLLIADSGTNRVRKLNVTTGIVTTVAGLGSGGDNTQAASASLSGPSSAVSDSAGNIFISDQTNGRVRRIDGTTGLITTIAGVTSGRGDGGAAVQAALNNPRGVAVGSDGSLYIGDTNNNKVRKVTASTGIITTFLGTGTAGNGPDGPATLSRVQWPGCVVVDANNNVYVADRGNAKIRRVDPTGTATTVVNSSGTGYNGDGSTALGVNILSGGGSVTNTTGINCVAADSLGNLYIADTSNNVIRQVSNGIITTAVGFITPSVNASGVSINTGVSGFAGDGYAPTAAVLSGPQGIGLDSTGTLLCIADTGNHVVRQVDFTKNVITTIAGIPNDGSSDGNLPIAGWQSRLNAPAGCAYDTSGNVYITDTSNNRILKVTSAGIMSLIAGGGTDLASDGKAALTARVSLPVAIATDAAGNVYFTERSGLIKKLTPGASQ